VTGVRALANPSDLRAVVFDAVGTLIYPAPPVCAVYDRIGRRHGAALGEAEIERRFRASFQQEEAHDRQLGYQTDEERERLRWAAIVRAVFHDQPDPSGPLAELWDHFARPDAWACFSDVAPCLEWLQTRGLRTGVASNFDQRLRRVVAGLPALRGCEVVAISSELGWRKPAPAFFQALLHGLSLPAEQVLLVGDDWENDYQGGIRAGMPVILLNRQRRPLEVPAITSLEELPGLFATGPHAS
jgi:putative hydrolase of the HAD superfamily